MSIMEQAPKRTGRPPKEGVAYMQPITVRFPSGMMADIESVMRERADQPEKGQVIREAVAIGLKAMRRGKDEDERESIRAEGS